MRDTLASAQRRRTPARHSPVLAGRVLAPPTLLESELSVEVLSQPGVIRRVGGWSPKGTVLPAAGDRVDLAEADDGALRVLGWATERPLTAAPAFYVGEIRMGAWTVAQIPAGWLPCDWSEVAPQHTALIAHLVAAGNPFGVGSSGRPRVPDLLGRSPMGAGTGSLLTTRTLGQKVGAEQHTLSIAEIPAHDHPGSGAAAHPFSAAGSATSQTSSSSSTRAHAVASQGGGQPHANVQPSTIVRFVIRT